MFNPAAVLAAAFGDHVAETYRQAFPDQAPEYADFLRQMARESLDHIGTSDAPYHNAEHTMMVTLVGQQIIQGKRQTCAVSPEDWVHTIVALLFHDIGFVRGICAGDAPHEVVINETGARVCPPRGATDASLAPYHVDRGKIYVRARFAGSDVIDPERLAQAIEHTRFPVPDAPAYADVEGEPALVRAADLIGQIADPKYLCKLSSLYSEFEETGMALDQGYASSMDLVETLPRFFEDQVEPLIGPALGHLRQTAEGRELVAQLFDRVSGVSAGPSPLGPFPGPPDTP